MTRGEGGSWPQPGDLRRGQPASYLSRVAKQAAADAQALDHTPLAALRIDTDGRAAGEAADLTAATAGWPGQGRGPEIPASRYLTGIWSERQTTAGPASRTEPELVELCAVFIHGGLSRSRAESAIKSLALRNG